MMAVFRGNGQQTSIVTCEKQVVDLAVVTIMPQRRRQQFRPGCIAFVHAGELERPSRHSGPQSTVQGCLPTYQCQLLELVDLIPLAPFSWPGEGGSWMWGTPPPPVNGFALATRSRRLPISCSCLWEALIGAILRPYGMGTPEYEHLRPAIRSCPSR